MRILIFFFKVEMNGPLPNVPYTLGKVPITRTLQKVEYKRQETEIA